MRKGALVALVGAGLGLAGCSASMSDPGAPYQTDVVVLQTPSNPTAPTQFSIQTRTLSSLRDVKGLSGDYALFRQGGDLVLGQVTGSLAQVQRFNNSITPRLRYDVQGGVIVPKDYNTLAMFSAFYNFETVLGSLQATTGVKTSDFLAKLGRIQVFFEPRSMADSNGSVTEKLNAAYVPGESEFILFRRSAVESLPLATNIQVIAHELGHAVFEYSFFNHDYQSCERLEQEYAISGVNEGFADFNSFVNTGSTDILRASIDVGTVADERNFGASTFTYDEFASSMLDTSSAEKVCDQSFYCIGTILAGSLYKAMGQLGFDPKSAKDRGTFWAQVVSALNGGKQAMLALPGSILPPNPTLQTCQNQAEAFHADGSDAPVVGAFLRVLVAGLPVASQNVVCDALYERFGNNAFPAIARQGYCTK